MIGRSLAETLSDDAVSSVVIVTRDRPMLLRALLEALKRQSVEPDEVIVVDNGPSDETRAVVKAAGSMYIPMPEAGLGAARQAGVHAASGRIVLFTDDDCLPDSNWLQVMIATFRGHPQLVGVQGATDAERGSIGRHAVQVSRPDPLYQTCNMAYRRDALVRAGGFDQRFRGYFEDTAMGARVLRLGPIGWEPSARVVHRAVERRPFTRLHWYALLHDEYLLFKEYPAHYKAYRGRGFMSSVVGHWLIGSPAKMLLRDLTRSPREPQAYAALAISLIRERWNLARALWDFCRDEEIPFSPSGEKGTRSKRSDA